MDLFEGLGSLGLNNLEGMNLYEENQKDIKDRRVQKKEDNKLEEKDMIFDKSYSCVICDGKFKSKTVKTGKARLLGADKDLRPKYEGIEPLKYEVVSCPFCGFTALSRFFVPMAPSQKRNIEEKICANVKPFDENGDVIEYQDALNRYKLALATSVVKMAKNSEKAFTCLKAGWLARSYAEELEKSGENESAHIREMEASFIRNAYDGFISAVAEENFPICGMDEQTMNYLLAVLAMRFEQYDVSRKLVANILTSQVASSRMKDKARVLKEELLNIRNK